MACIPDRKRHDRAIEVGPQGNVVFTNPLNQIAEVPDNRIDRGVRIKMGVRSHVTHTEIEANNAV